MYPLNLGRLFLHSRVFLDRLGRDSGRGLRAVANLRVGRARADRAPSLAAGHTHAHANSDN